MHEPDEADWPEWEEAMAAWDELVPEVPAAEIRAAVAADIAVLSPQPEKAVAEAAPLAPSAEVAESAVPAKAPEPSVVPKAGADVNAALRGADARADTLKNHREWQRIQTVRGALGHLWEGMKEKAGPYWENLKADIRVQGFLKTVSIRACEAISSSASALARKLQGDLPTADALLKLSDATLTYSNVATEAKPEPAPASVATSAKEPVADPMPHLVERATPKAYATREDSVRAAREVTQRFQEWIASPMGQELVSSDHRRVAAFRDAWQQLPPYESGPGPAVGPYGEVAEHAKALVTAAVGAARFAPGDLQALQALAQSADRHAARLAVTLPPGAATPAPKAATPAPRAAVPAPAAARIPRASV
ncbi:hypothetical protein ACWGDE_21445 [Streptomyces sp. NPDC054956]